MSDQDSSVRALSLQAQACQSMGSPFSAGILRQAAEDVADGGPTRALLAPWRVRGARAQIADAVPLRLLGALHDLVLSGEAPALSALYPSPNFAGDPAGAWSVAADLLETQSGRIAAFMGHEPQTNETRRSVALLPGFLTVASETGMPIRCFEIAASAGLNQLWDRYRYDLGEAGAWGDPDSDVRLDTDWRGPPPPLDASVQVIERAACDRAPVDVRDPVARRRLKAYVWPDQLERLARLEAAIQCALAAGGTVEAENALTWPRRRAVPRVGAATVLFHSVFWTYLSSDDQASLESEIGRLGAQATPSSPFAWLRIEPPPDNIALMDIRLTLWPPGEERLLGRCHPHAAWVEWLG